jgi:serine/threonine protein kinase
MKSNIFTTNLHDVILTEDLSNESKSSAHSDVPKNGLFLVIDYVESDIKKVLESVKHGTILHEDHIVTILYNILCSVKFLHASNVIHRDIKPGNLLINSQCGVKIADYGLSRSMQTAGMEDQ